MLTRESVAAEACRCVRCSFCRGNGFTSSYERNQFDWDTETCEECGGSGITETCGRCEYLRDLDYE